MSLGQSVYDQSPLWLQTLLFNAHAWRVERHRYGPPYRDALTSLLVSERWQLGERRAYQDERVRVVVRTAYDRVPFYQEAMHRVGVSPDHIRGVEDLPKLPLLTKDAVRARSRELTTNPRPLRDWLHGHTSGTTGSPLGIWYDRNTCILTNAVDRRQKVWAGMRDRDWIGLFLGRMVVPQQRSRPAFWRTNWVQRQVWFSSFHMSDEWLPYYVAEIRRRGLQFLEGYPSTLFVLASYLRRRAETLPMRCVLTSSETLHTMQRETIEAAFECRLFDFYALAERVIYAGECEAHDGKHLAEEYGYTEVVDEEGNPVPDGQPGYLVGTSLHNLAMPMIRYRTADVSAISTDACSCGRSLRRIRTVTTKAEDIVVTPDGRMVSPSVLTHPFKPLDQIVKSQIVQDRLDHLIVKLVPSAEFTPEEERSLVRSLRERLGPGMTIDVRLVDDIPREPSGKYRWVISHVDHSCAVPWESVHP